MHDIIYIEQLETEAIIGIYDWEREQPQPLYFDIEMAVPIFTAAQSDAINDTVDYAQVSDFVCDWVAKSRVELLETLLENLSHELFTRFTGIQTLTIKVSKPKAVAQAKTVGLIIKRQRPR
ncbi:7,8-dihydroneopterin aldolase [Thiosulfatimonas sediminis]|uniref:7,8-dihydroneopterin aldolase n=1 Tax=Thiosulfatimonas sediminis TaxID=2675054 RepID=A0A6F8PX90_9GAMM|nr:dihydroneopterin aldolase [Thiosulfatimonas sediminis]BBP46741.1 7,8-dihydroneopterin aldolase [Thiosulfatimonas sediminis]